MWWLHMEPCMEAHAVSQASCQFEPSTGLGMIFTFGGGLCRRQIKTQRGSAEQ